MGRYDDGAGTTYFLDEVSYFDDLIRIETARRFVENKNFGVLHERMGKSYALFVSTRKFADILVHHLGKPTDIREGSYFRVGIHALHCGDIAQIVVDDHVTVERCGLRHVAYFSLNRNGRFGNIHTVDADRTATWSQKTGDHAHGCSLAGSIRPQQTDDLPRRYGNTDVVYRAECPKGAGHMRQFNHRKSLRRL